MGNIMITKTYRDILPFQGYRMRSTQSFMLRTRRDYIVSVVALIGKSYQGPSLALERSLRSSGYELYVDRTYGYSLLRPKSWNLSRTSENAVFYRNPNNLNENLSVIVSSPSLSKLASVGDIGEPREVAETYIENYLREFTSTRIGVKKETQLISAYSRINSVGEEYYDLEFIARSFASRQQLAITQSEREQELEWSRKIFTSLSVNNGRLYEFRIQTEAAIEDTFDETIPFLRRSFECRPVVI